MTSKLSDYEKTQTIVCVAMHAYQEDMVGLPSLAEQYQKSAKDNPVMSITPSFAEGFALWVRYDNLFRPLLPHDKLSVLFNDDAYKEEFDYLVEDVFSYTLDNRVCGYEYNTIIKMLTEDYTPTLEDFM